MPALLVLPILSLVAFVAFDVRYLRERSARVPRRWRAQYGGWLQVAHGVVYAQQFFIISDRTQHGGWLHLARGVAYTLQFFAISGLWFDGVGRTAFAALFGVATTVVAIAAVEVLCALRPRSGLPEARTSRIARLGGRP